MVCLNLVDEVLKAELPVNQIQTHESNNGLNRRAFDCLPFPLQEVFVSTTTPTLVREETPIHDWLKQIHVAFVPGPTSPVLEDVIDGLLGQFEELGNVIDQAPGDQTDVIFTTAPFGTPIKWRQAMIFTARSRFKLNHTPAFITMLHCTPAQFHEMVDKLNVAISKPEPDPADFDFPGLAPTAYKTLYEQGHRGGPILAMERVLQTQAMSIRVLLVVGDDRPEAIYHFDLVGAFPASMRNGGGGTQMYRDAALRVVTAMSSTDIHHHTAVGDPLPRAIWDEMTTPDAMCFAARELGLRNFFTDTVHVSSLTAVPAVGHTVASQYSEGCFSTWDTDIDALVATVTGSARPVEKAAITEADLVIITGVREDGMGALVRNVDDKVNDPPSSEAVEMYEMDADLPQVRLDDGSLAPVIRSKLHGHRGVLAFDPRYVEYVPLDAPYFGYPVTCGTDAQARGARQAFSRSQAFRNENDARQVAFTILPGHGVIFGEKWIDGKEPFQVMWEYMDAGYIEIDSHVPQIAFDYVSGDDGRLYATNTHQRLQF